MHIKKYGPEFTRRKFMESLTKGAGTAGVLTSLWPLIGHSADDISKAYPDELLSIEMYTKGKVKPGDVITADNVEHVKDLLTPIAYEQVKSMGRRITIVESTKDVTNLYPYEYLDATLRNQGKAVLDKEGNVRTKDGRPWIGGNPFPQPKNGIEAMYNLTLSWGRHNYSQYAIRDWDLDPDGGLSYVYDFAWAELNANARSDDKTWKGKDDILRYQSVWFTSPSDASGTSFLSIWHYDQNKFPDLYGYIPAFRRVRQYPTNQRFEPLVPGVTFFLSDAWSSGDPLLTWGNYKIVDRKPMLGAVSPKNFNGGYHDNYEKPAHGGPQGQTFYDTYMELVPECLVIDAEPTGYPRAPVGKKRVWVDARNQHFIGYMTFDRRGEMWKSFEPAFAQYKNDKLTVMDGNHPLWSWVHVMSHDIQSNRMSRFVQVKEIAGGYKSIYDPGDVDVYNKFLTVQAMQRLGG
ncbi:DUF1329 domain-containing protein [Spongiibacter nanhainus]|uniref:DUF1329 domain-containing protein n=1 Tax=Spongiibacter nanhainus TaxID=2794344 RepID=A0A7T4UPW0_9GAMM|nr:DUF1329 domain-containing protein [Spongiibacter nanhainus]QQD17947.1 DUF1329 domain-containing protein [Spongiibacter nanhainus]